MLEKNRAEKIAFAIPVLMGAVLAAGCSDSPADISPEVTLSELQIEVAGDGILLRGWVEESGAAVISGQATVTVQSESGDSEPVSLSMAMCEHPDPDHGAYPCHELFFGVEAGRDVREYEASVRDLDGFFMYVAPDFTSAGVYFPERDAAELLDVVSSWDGMRFVELSGFFCVDQVGADCGVDADLESGIPVDAKASGSEDGVLTAAAGEWVEARYERADGTILSARTSIP